MLVNQLLAGRRLQEIEAAILAAAALAALHGDDVARLADAEGIARELLYLPDEIFYDYSLEAWIATLTEAAGCGAEVPRNRHKPLSRHD